MTEQWKTRRVHSGLGCLPTSIDLFSIHRYITLLMPFCYAKSNSSLKLKLIPGPVLETSCAFYFQMRDRAALQSVQIAHRLGVNLTFGLPNSCTNSGTSVMSMHLSLYGNLLQRDIQTFCFPLLPYLDALKSFG